MPEDKAVAVRGESPRLPVEVLKQELADLQVFVKGQMVEGVDFGKIPGTPKPTLFKPGAEKLLNLYSYRPKVEVTSRMEDWQSGFFHYEVKVTALADDGRIMGEGIGSCNTRESRYAYRWTFESQLPQGTDKNKLQRRTINLKNGSKAPQYRVDNEDIYGLVNTILKMAKKRAMIDCALSVTRTSALFTQDVEDFLEADYTVLPANGEAAASPPKTRGGQERSDPRQSAAPAEPKEPAPDPFAAFRLEDGDWDFAAFVTACQKASVGGDELQAVLGEKASRNAVAKWAQAESGRSLSQLIELAVPAEAPAQ